jgi:hypothetical protein
MICSFSLIHEQVLYINITVWGNILKIMTTLINSEYEHSKAEEVIFTSERTSIQLHLFAAISPPPRGEGVWLGPELNLYVID